MPFDASDDSIPKLEWRFKPYVDAEGVTDEPSDDQVFAMNEALRGNIRSVTGKNVDPTDRAAIAKAFSKLSDDELRKTMDAQVDAIVHVTVLSPTREQIEALPYRQKRAYVKSLIKDINDPEGETSDMNS